LLFKGRWGRVKNSRETRWTTLETHESSSETPSVAINRELDIAGDRVFTITKSMKAQGLIVIAKNCISATSEHTRPGGGKKVDKDDQWVGVYEALLS